MGRSSRTPGKCSSHSLSFAETFVTIVRSLRLPRRLDSAYLSPEAVLEIATGGKALDCKEALFTLGDKPELRYRAARDWLEQAGYASTNRLCVRDGGARSP